MKSDLQGLCHRPRSYKLPLEFISTYSMSMQNINRNSMWAVEPQITLNCPFVNGPFHQPYKSNLAQYKLAYWSMPHLWFTNVFFYFREISLRRSELYYSSQDPVHKHTNCRRCLTTVILSWEAACNLHALLF